MPDCTRVQNLACGARSICDCTLVRNRHTFYTITRHDRRLWNACLFWVGFVNAPKNLFWDRREMVGLFFPRDRGFLAVFWLVNEPKRSPQEETPLYRAPPENIFSRTNHVIARTLSPGDWLRRYHINIVSPDAFINGWLKASIDFRREVLPRRLLRF